MTAVRSVTRALAVLECFDADSSSLPLHELTARLKLAKSTTYRLVSTLVDAGYLIRREDNRYCLSLQLLRLGGVVASTLEIRDVVRPAMLEVSAVCDETVEVSLLSGDERICIDVIESPSPLKSIVRVGERFSLFYGATGLTFLAFMPEARRNVLLRKLPADLRAARDGFVGSLDAIRERGFGLTTGQRVPGASAVSAPIFNMLGEVEYCMTITGPTARFAGRESEFASELVRVCRGVSARLGHVSEDVGG